MGRGHRAAERAGRSIAHCRAGVAATGRARRDDARRIQLDVGRQIRGQRDRIRRLLTLFQRELVGRRVNLAEVVDTGVGLRGRTGFHKVRNRDRCQQADDGHNNHDFNQGETRITEVLVRFHLLLVFFFTRREQNSRRVYIITSLFTLIACCNRDGSSLAVLMPELNKNINLVESLFFRLKVSLLPIHHRKNFPT